MAVVKANAYGHGLLRVAQGLNQADGFAVLGLDEAVFLRESGFNQTILMLEGVFKASELNEAASAGISLVVHNQAQIKMLEDALLAEPVTVFVKMNTGMNRLGFTPEHYAGAIDRLTACPNVAQITLMTHFATADDDVGVAKPLSIFQQTTKAMLYPASLANSAAILRHPETHADWVRPGIMLYGATPVSGTAAKSYKLQPAMTLSSEIIAIQELMAGESVGYGQKFTADRHTRVGIVACGYADGYPRHAPSGTPIAVNGKLTRTLGRVSMDMLFADITDIPEAAVGSSVELWGHQVPVDVVAEASGTVGYELLCALAARVPVRVVA
ncbi:MAG: alanine racemase [Nitrosomonadales bacterium]|nr:alanine racemase [Nitrosomonadales bacterium]